MIQWTAIERNLLTSENLIQQNTMINSVDALYNSVQVFQDSQMLRIFRQIPSIRQTNNTVNAADTISSFRTALAGGDRDKALLLAADIHNVLAEWLVWDGRAEQYSSSAYFRLFVVFLAFITLTAFAIITLNKTLNRSIGRELESSVFSHAFFLAQEEERERISRELHDTIAQDLRRLSLGMEKISRTEDPGEREKLCGETSASQSDLIRRVRDICDDLVPPDFRFQGLGDVIRRLCLDFGKRTGIDCRADIMEGAKLNSLNSEKQLQVFRIVQEALTNIDKHAQAKEAIVTIRSDPQGLYIGISDDGKGFNYPPPSGETTKRGQLDTKRQQLGIRSMEKRAALLGGSFRINSESKEGTLVCLEIPYNSEQGAGSSE